MKIDASALSPSERERVQSAIHDLLSEPESIIPKPTDQEREDLLDYEIAHNHKPAWYNAGEGATTSWEAFLRDKRAREAAEADKEIEAALARRHEDQATADAEVIDRKVENFEVALANYASPTASVPESPGQPGASGGGGGGRY